MKEPELLANEKIDLSLRPHPLSFFSHYFVAALLLIWSLVSYYFLLRIEPSAALVYENFYEPFLLTYFWIWIGGTLTLGVIISILSIRWRYFFLYGLYLLVGLGILYYGKLYDLRVIFLYSLVATLIGIAGVEFSRRSHQFFLTNQRLLLRGGIVTKHERALAYENISDVGGRQSLVGRMFNYGSLTPITVSGFGLGTDQTAAGGAVRPGMGSRIPILRHFWAFFGGGKTVQAARARTFYELYGIHPYDRVKSLFQQKAHEFTRGAQAAKSLDVQKQILEELRKKESEKEYLEFEELKKRRELEELRKREKEKQILEELKEKEVELNALIKRKEEVELERQRKEKELEELGKGG
jgi:hypothetical protein